MNKKIKKFISYYRPYRWLFCTDMFFAIVGALVSLVFPILIRIITGTVLKSETLNMNYLYILAIIFLVIVALEYICNYYVAYQGHTMGVYMERDMRNELFAHLQKLSFHFYDKEKTEKLVSSLAHDLFSLTELFHHGPEDIVISVIKFVGAILILSTINMTLTVFVFITVPVIVIIAIHYNRYLKRAYARNQVHMNAIHARMEEDIMGIPTVKNFGNENFELQKFYDDNEQYAHSKRASYYYMGKYNAGLNGFISMIRVIIVFFGLILISQEEIYSSDLIAFVLYINNLIEPIKKLVDFSTEVFHEGRSSYARFIHILELEPDVQDAPDARELQEVKGDILYDHVSFSFSKDKDYIFNNISLHVRPGETIAIVGGSGVGKTTLCALLARFFEVTSGKITIDGEDIRSFTQSSLRNAIGIVQQETYLYSGSILENIRYGNLLASDEEVKAAAKAANAHDFIIDLPNGYQTDCAQHGLHLSIDQKQRINNARVFLRDPTILIVDEATNGQDSESDRIMQESLYSLVQNRTTLIIAHRLSTVTRADRICLITKEGAVEQGTHEQLLHKNGQYASYYTCNLINKKI